MRSSIFSIITLALFSAPSAGAGPLRGRYDSIWDKTFTMTGLGDPWPLAGAPMVENFDKMVDLFCDAIDAENKKERDLLQEIVDATQYIAVVVPADHKKKRYLTSKSAAVYRAYIDADPSCTCPVEPLKR